MGGSLILGLAHRHLQYITSLPVFVTFNSYQTHHNPIPPTMKLTTTLIHFLFITLVASRSFSLFGDQSPLNPEDNDLKVPGKNPLTFCQDPKDDILAIEYVDLTPNPPEAYVSAPHSNKVLQPQN